MSLNRREAGAMKLGTFVGWRPLKELGSGRRFRGMNRRKSGQGATKPTPLRHDPTERHHAKQAKVPTERKRAKGN